MSHATPQDTIAALRTRYTGELAVADAATPGWSIEGRHDGGGTPIAEWDIYGGPVTDVDETRLEIVEVALFYRVEDAHLAAAARESVPRDARLKLALLDQVEAGLAEAAQAKQSAQGNIHALAWETQSAVLTATALATLRLLAESAGEAVAW